MEEQLFSPSAAAQLFDLPLSSGGLIGFSPSIDTESSLPLTFGDSLETSAFMLEVQRKRADTVTTLKPDFDFKDDFGCDTTTFFNDIPQRPRAAQRLSLTPSIGSSAASTASEYDDSGFDSEADLSYAASPAADDACAAQWTDSSFNPFDASASIQSAFNRINFHSPSGEAKDATIRASTFNHHADFSFNEFIEDAEHGAQKLAASAIVGAIPTGDDVSCVMNSQVPISPLNLGEAQSQCGHGHVRYSGSESSLGIFQASDVGAVHMPMQPYHLNSYYGNAGPCPMVFSQSAPDATCFHPHGSPCPSSPSSARSSSPFPTFGMAGAMPSVLASPPSRQDQIQVQHVPAQAPGLAMLPKGMSLYSHFAHLANPYAGLITKRSRGRRVPNKPEEMNNLGKSGKVYTCKVPGCGKCFKRSEHLKRHVRSIHTDDKPFLCPFPSCNKRFSRHDNLNQHARVHTSMGGGVAGSAGEEYDASSVHPMSQIHMALAHPMVLTAAPQGGISIASGPTPQIKQEN
ncbi:potential zinc finger protein [Pseudozyma hubeiensis SY62]|uniref:Potential zinc finger protein n=1 Tax=Pseudozyma hubeiensis (strain SY62) TaxID=1305764 RepID=R9P7J4_PSEHS|nr:potential zinc finger protein [Pseudozyma hubeiensis SY62]GAC97343.1 potential zinc finger protein [Pseudozyma hubeiensis SY62]